MHAGAIGDLVLTLHVVRAIRMCYPHASSTLAARCELARWFARRGVVDRAVSLESLAIQRWFADEPDGQATQALNAFDLVISFLAGPDAMASRQLSSALTARVVTVAPQSNEQAGRAPRHITEQWLAELASAGLQGFAIDPTQPLVDLPRRHSSAVGGHVICHPGSGGKAKCPPLENYEAVVRSLQQRGAAVRWMVGPAERDWYGQEYVDRLVATAPVIEEHDLSMATDYIANADAYLGNDAGMTHVAAALGRTTLAFFGPTDSTIWRPLGPHVHLLDFDHLRDAKLIWNRLRDACRQAD